MGRRIAKWLGAGLLGLLALAVLYALVSLILTFIPVGKKIPACTEPHAIFLSSNGMHLDIILPIGLISDSLRKGLHYEAGVRYLGFGWGDRDFYLNTPTWKELDVGVALKALFWPSDGLIHVTRFSAKRPDWKEIPVCTEQLAQINTLINQAFEGSNSDYKALLVDQGYGPRDDFYLATGSFSCFNTCNSWTNRIFRQSGLRACLWTPFYFGLMQKHE